MQEQRAIPGHGRCVELVYWISGGVWVAGELAFLLNKHDSGAAERLRPRAEALANSVVSKVAHLEKLEALRSKGRNVGRIDIQADKTKAELSEAASEALRLGLENRIGLMTERGALDYLLGAGGELPLIPRVCVSCDMVFQPGRRKGAAAYKCRACHESPKPDWVTEPGRIVSVAPTIDPNTLEHRGWRRRTHIFCRACGTWSESKSSTKGLWCPEDVDPTGKCKKKVQRGKNLFDLPSSNVEPALGLAADSRMREVIENFRQLVPDQDERRRLLLEIQRGSIVSTPTQ